MAKTKKKNISRAPRTAPKKTSPAGLPARRFQKRVEDFTCENCGRRVKGSGYTDHCPYCLWSKHVDINPGDRLCTCQGLMRPVSLEANSKGYVIHYKCRKCGHLHRVKSDRADSFEKMLELAAHYQ